LLRAAACVIAEVGYEPATMLAIAERAESSIGSLYQFFPNKESVVEALRAQYVKELEKLLAELAAETRGLPVDQFVSCLIRSQIKFAEGHPALLALVDAPLSNNSSRRHEIIRGGIARVILARKPTMSRSKALRLAAVVQQILRGLLTLYARTDDGERAAIRDEFQSVLTAYLALRLPGQRR
jgi:AcrR family transcriptional regulator